MGRPSVIRWALVILLCSLWGCTASRPIGPFAWFGGEKKPEEATASTEKPKEENPFKKGEKKDSKPTDAAKSETAVASSEKTPEKPADGAKETAAKPDSAKTPAAVSHDAETLALIESELKDFTPEERAQFEKDLKGLDPALVRSLLRTVRMTRQMGQYAPSQVAQASVEDPANRVMQASTTAQDAAVNAALTAMDHSRSAAGLGTVQPWNNTSSVSMQPPVYGQPAATANPVGAYTQGSPLDSRAASAGVGVTIDPNAFNSNVVGGQSSPQGYAGLAPGPVSPGNEAGLQNPPWNGGAPSNSGVVTAGTGNNFGGQLWPPSNAPQNNSGVGSGRPTVPVVQVTGVYPSPPNTAGDLRQPMTAQQLNSQAPISTVGGSPQWKADLDRLIAAAEGAARGVSPGTTDAEKQAYVEQQVYLRMLYLMAGQQQRALEAIRDINGADQEFWQQVFWSLSNYFDDEVMPDPADRAAQTVAQLRSAVQRLEENARLELRNVNFCHKISSFGNYERFQRDEFSPNQDVLVYAEVNNFKSEPTADGQYRTLLRSTIEIYRAGPGSELVASMPFDPTPDLCYNHRRDYFHSYVVTIPPNIGLGPYLLKLRVNDELSGKMAEYVLKFTVK